jgi:hypothetical protein
VEVEIHSFSVSLSACPRSFRIETSAAEMTPVSYPKQSPEMAAQVVKSNTKNVSWKKRKQAVSSEFPSSFMDGMCGMGKSPSPDALPP